MTKKNLAAVKKLKLKLQSFYKVGPKEAKAVYKALSWAHEESQLSYQSSNVVVSTLARLRDLAAVAVGKPTLAQLDEDDY